MLCARLEWLGSVVLHLYGHLVGALKHYWSKQMIARMNLELHQQQQQQRKLSMTATEDQIYSNKQTPWPKIQTPNNARHREVQWNACVFLCAELIQFIHRFELLGPITTFEEFIDFDTVSIKKYKKCMEATGLWNEIWTWQNTHTHMDHTSKHFNTLSQIQLNRTISQVTCMWVCAVDK